LHGKVLKSISWCKNGAEIRVTGEAKGKMMAGRIMGSTAFLATRSSYFVVLCRVLSSLLGARAGKRRKEK
jgi:hypothetical protein